MTSTDDEVQLSATATEVLAFLLANGVNHLAAAINNVRAANPAGPDVLALSVGVAEPTVTLHTAGIVDAIPRPWTISSTVATDLVAIDIREVLPDPPIPMNSADIPTTPKLVIAGVQPNGEILLINLSATPYLGMQGPNTIPIARSWVTQLALHPTTTITSVVPDLIPHVPSPRISHPDTATRDADIAFTTTAPDAATGTTINVSPTDDLEHIVFTPADRSAEVFLGDRTFPLWRTLSFTEAAWTALADTLTPPENPAPPIPHVWVRVLGPVQIASPNGVTSTATTGTNTPSRETELLTRLALAGSRGLPEQSVLDILWPGEKPADPSRSMLEQLSTFRRKYGQISESSNERIILRRDRKEANAAVRINPDVTTDWQIFTELIPATPSAATTENLTAALELVRGTPFEDAPPGRYEWAAHFRDRILDATADAAKELATRLATTNPARAHHAAVTGTRANPERQDLWQLALNTAPTTTAARDLVRDLDRHIAPKDQERSTRKATERATKQ